MNIDRREALALISYFLVFWNSMAIAQEKPRIVFRNDITKAVSTLAQEAAADARAQGWDVPPATVAKVTEEAVSKLEASMLGDFVVIRGGQESRPVQGRIFAVGANLEHVKLGDGKLLWITKDFTVGKWAMGKELKATYEAAGGKNWITSIEYVGGDK